MDKRRVLGDAVSRVQVGLDPGGPSRPMLGFTSALPELGSYREDMI